MHELESTSHRLARSAFELFAHERFFEIMLYDERECEEVAVALEGMGCLVHRTIHESFLTVTAPVA